MKRVLVLDHPEHDFGAYMLVDGLCRVIGTENVIVYPFKKIYAGQVANDYTLDDGKTGFTSPPEFITPRDMPNWSMDEICKRRNEFDLVLLNCPRTYALRGLRELRNRTGNSFRPLCLADHEDYDGFKDDIIGEFHFDYIFKREYRKDRQYANNIFPLPFSSMPNAHAECGNLPKEIDVFLSCGNTYGLRQAVVDKVKTISGINAVVNGNERRYNYDDYHKMIAKSKIAIAVRGWGVDTVRHWEISQHATLMFTHEDVQQIPNPFVDGVNAVYYNTNLTDLEEKIRWWLAHDEEREKVALAGCEHLQKYHTTEARARYFLDKCGFRVGE